MAKNENNQDTRHNRHDFDDEGSDFDPNDPSQMPDGSPFPAGLMLFVIITLISGLVVPVLRKLVRVPVRFSETPTALILTVIGNTPSSYLLHAHSPGVYCILNSDLKD